MKIKKREKSFVRNIVWVAGGVLLFILIAGEMRFFYSNSMYSEEIFKKYTIFSQLQADRISTRINEVIVDLEILAKLNAQGIITDQHTILTYIKHLLVNKDEIDSFLLLDRRGYIQDCYPEKRELIGLDMSNQDYFILSTRDAPYYISKTFLSPFTGNLTVAISYRLSSGYAVCDYNLEKMKSSIHNIPGDDSIILLVDTNGVVITHNANAQNYSGMNLKNLTAVADGLAGQEGTFNQNFNGTSGIMSVARIQNTDWMLLVFESDHDAFGSMYRTRMLGFAFVLCLLLFLVAVLLISYRHFLRPVLSLVEQTKLVARGESMDLPDPEYKEFKELNENFAMMLSSLQNREEILKRNLKERDVLLKEIHHRVKNNMQVITSLLNIQSSREGSDCFRAAVEQCTSRIKSMAIVHEQLYRQNDFSGINISEYMDKLLRNISMQWSKSDTRIRIEKDIAAFNLDLSAAVPFGLIANEIITNAYKHAFSGMMDGVIHVQIHAADDGYIVFRVHDNGSGFPASFNAEDSGGLGFTIITSLVQQISGRIECRNENGSVVEIIFPLKDVHDV